MRPLRSLTGAFLLATVLTGPGTWAGEPALTGLDQLRWEHRIVLLFADAETARSERPQLLKEEAALQERDMTWFLVEAGVVTASNYPGILDPVLGATLMQRFAPIRQPLEVILVGKDGGIKARGDRLDVVALVDQVDRMPMRRQEMREGDQ